MVDTGSDQDGLGPEADHQIESIDRCFEVIRAASLAIDFVGSATRQEVGPDSSQGLEPAFSAPSFAARFDHVCSHLLAVTMVYHSALQRYWRPESTPMA